MIKYTVNRGPSIQAPVLAGNIKVSLNISLGTGELSQAAISLPSATTMISYIIMK
ncbi:MAG: hypothetical protein IJV72_00480 [Clostridia bacterium]|nr:hypothetical protein [Clostridia bacterium]